MTQKFSTWFKKLEDKYTYLRKDQRRMTLEEYTCIGYELDEMYDALHKLDSLLKYNRKIRPMKDINDSNNKGSYWKLSDQFFKMLGDLYFKLDRQLKLDYPEEYSLEFSNNVLYASRRCDDE